MSIQTPIPISATVSGNSNLIVFPAIPIYRSSGAKSVVAKITWGVGLVMGLVLFQPHHRNDAMSFTEFADLPKPQIVQSATGNGGRLAPVTVALEQGPQLMAAPGVAEIQSGLGDAIEEIVALTGMTKTQVATKLFGVDRQSMYNWKRGSTGIKPANLERILQVRDILVRAQRSASDTGLSMSEWLLTPRGFHGETPQQLILEGKYVKARSYAMTEPSSRTTTRPEWLNERKSSSWRTPEGETQIFIPGSEDDTDERTGHA